MTKMSLHLMRVLVGLMLTIGIQLAAASIRKVALAGGQQSPVAIWFTENFDSVTPPNLPADWAKMDVNGTAGDWATNAGTVHPLGSPAYSAPNLAYFNAYSASNGSTTRLYRTTGLDLSQVSKVELSLWMFHDDGYSTYNDRVQVQVSTDGGVTWQNVGEPIPRYDGSTGWKQHIVDLSAYAGQSEVRLGFLGISEYGNDVHIDEITVMTSYQLYLPLVAK